MSSKAVKIVIAVAVLALGAYWYWSPLLVARTLREAAEKRDAETFNDHVDYPKLRESLKGELAAALAAETGEAMRGGDDAARSGAALGALIGGFLVDKMVDAFVRPEVVMRAVEEARLSPKPAPAEGSPAPADAHGDERARHDDTRWIYERRGASKVIAWAVERDDESKRRLGVVFERSGFANWKMTGIHLPAAHGE